MANSLREVKTRIDSTKSTAQITKAMYMVSQSKVKRSEKTKNNYKSFLQDIRNLTKTALSVSKEFQNIMLEEQTSKRSVYVLVSSDTGLAGGYNNQIFRFFNEYSANILEDYLVATIGRKAYNYALNKDFNLINKNAILVRDDVMFLDIVPIVDAFVKLYMQKEVDHVYIIYNHYVNSLQTEVKMEQLLPLTKIEGETLKGEYLFEGGVTECLDHLMKMYLEAQIYGIILDAKAAEHSSRMNAMKNASDNVDEIVLKYELIYNRARQQAITTELVDIIAGSNAVKHQDSEAIKDDITEKLYHQYEQERAIKYFTLFSAAHLEQTEKTEIINILSKFYQNYEIRLISKIDESIVDGYYLIINNKRLDFNLKTLFSNLKNQL